MFRDPGGGCGDAQAVDEDLLVRVGVPANDFCLVHRNVQGLRQKRHCGAVGRAIPGGLAHGHFQLIAKLADDALARCAGDDLQAYSDGIALGDHLEGHGLNSTPW
jgi:hypothetical protein